MGITHFRAQLLWGNVAAAKLLAAVGILESRETIGGGVSETVHRLR